MNRDEITLVLGDKEVNFFSSYSIESNLFQADDQFTIEVADMDLDIKNGEKALILLNGKRILTGVIDRIEKRFSKGERALSLTGRSIMAFLIDNHISSYKNLSGSLEKLTNELLVDIRKIPFFGNQFKTIEFQKGIKRVIGSDATTQAEPGQTIFEVLDKVARSRGLMLFDTPDGRLIFGKPKEMHSIGDPFSINVDFTAGCDVIEGSSTLDISDIYNEIQIQCQTDSGRLNANNAYTYAPKVDFLPFKKRMVEQVNKDSETPKNTAREIHEKQMAQAFQLTYTIPGHTQNGKIWEINEFCDVTDSVLNVTDRFLIYSRRFELSKSGGTITTLSLGRPGVIL